jgi:hypothetical protein
LQFTAHGHRIVVEELVEISHAEEEQGIGILPLGRRPLTHKRREVGHCLVGCGGLWRAVIGAGQLDRGLFVFSNHVAFKTIVTAGTAVDARPVQSRAATRDQDLTWFLEMRESFPLPGQPCRPTSRMLR